ncbi:MAG: relaxase MobL [Ruminococcus sp.]|nr:relaxase MobL [Ruminococcus sp.]
MNKPVINAAVILKTKFLNPDDSSWNIGGSDFCDYLDKCDFAFDNEKDSLDENDFNDFREHEQISKSEGCPKYLGVISFNNDVLIDNGLMINGEVDAKALMDVGRKSINALVANSDKLVNSNCYWMAGIHTDTDNVHLQFQLLEYHRLEDRKKIYRDEDALEQKALDACKSAAAHSVIRSELSKELTDYERNVLLKKLSASLETSDKKIEDLIKSLPQNRAWQYNRLNKDMQNMINSCVRSIINDNAELKADYQAYIEKIEDLQNSYKDIYGKKSRYHNYKESRLYGRDGFYSRAGNALLNACKAEVSNRANLSEKKPEVDNSHNDDYIPNVSDDYSYDDEAYLSENEIEADICCSDEIDCSNDGDYVLDANGDYDNDDEEYLSETKTVPIMQWSGQYREACKLLFGENEDYKKSEALLLRESERGNVLADYTLGQMYSADKYGVRDDDKSFAHYAKALSGFLALEPLNDKMKPYIQYRIGKMYCYGLGTQKDEKEAFDWFQKSAKAGNKFAQFSLANMYYYGSGVDKNLSEAFNWYSKAAKQDQPYADFALGKMYQNGEFVEQSDAKAYECYAKALSGFLQLEGQATQPDGDLLYKIGCMYNKGLGTELDTEKAISYFTRSSELGNANAQYMMGKHFLSSDSKKAYGYFRAASDKLPLAAYYAGKLLIENGASSDMPEGLRLLRQAADNDVDPACYYLGKYLFSQESRQMKSEGFTYLLKSADEFNNAYAQYMIGKIYLSENKIDKAREYLNRSYENGNEYAKNLLNKHLSKSTISVHSQSAVSAVKSFAMSHTKLIGRSAAAINRELAREKAKTMQLMREFERDEQIRQSGKSV